MLRRRAARQSDMISLGPWLCHRLNPRPPPRPHAPLTRLIALAATPAAAALGVEALERELASAPRRGTRGRTDARPHRPRARRVKLSSERRRAGHHTYSLSAAARQCCSCLELRVQACIGPSAARPVRGASDVLRPAAHQLFRLHRSRVPRIVSTRELAQRRVRTHCRQQLLTRQLFDHAVVSHTQLAQVAVEW